MRNLSCGTKPIRELICEQEHADLCKVEMEWGHVVIRMLCHCCTAGIHVWLQCFIRVAIGQLSQLGADIWRP